MSHDYRDAAAKLITEIHDISEDMSIGDNRDEQEATRGTGTWITLGILGTGECTRAGDQRTTEVHTSRGVAQRAITVYTHRRPGPRDYLLNKFMYV